jgi:iron(III) transport system permease protein
MESLLALVMPISVLLFWLFRGISVGRGVGEVWDETFRSVGISVLAAAIAAVAAFPVAMVTTRRRNKFSDVAESAVWATYSIPHIAVGVAIVGFALAVVRPLYQSLALLLLTYAVMFLAQALSTAQDSLKRASPDLEDASRGLGRGALATLRHITVPLAAPGLLAGFALVFLSVMKELPATLLLRPNGFETLAIRIWSTTGEGFYTQAAVAGLALLAVSIFPLLAVTRRDLSD